ncbi:MAG: 50S ribosomal protein L11 methyltransferase [Chloroflexi bacterium]|nr:50S ribosomal protein L11 methyltransferase [Chloroflexota bacterium]
MAEPHWLEVSLVVDGELAEAIADVLGRFVSNGVVIESGASFDETEEHATPQGPVRVYGYLPVNDRLDENRRRLEETLWHLGQIQPLPPAVFTPIIDEDWIAAWKQHYHPIPVGKRLLIVPAWVDLDPGKRLPIRIDPSMAFGTGTHPSTQLSLELLESYVPHGQPVIDVGCGSGILSIAALKLGASHALAVDIDPQAVRSTLENASGNTVIDRIETGQGSVDEILRGGYTIKNAPLVLANILAPVIVRLFEEGLGELVARSGVLILSGILAEQSGEVAKAALEFGFEINDRRQMGDWVALAVVRHSSA